jgi:hypothetical protein
MPVCCPISITAWPGLPPCLNVMLSHPRRKPVRQAHCCPLRTHAPFPPPHTHTGCFSSARTPHGFACVTSPDGIRFEAYYSHGRLDCGDVRITWPPEYEGQPQRMWVAMRRARWHPRTCTHKPTGTTCTNMQLRRPRPSP